MNSQRSEVVDRNTALAKIGSTADNSITVLRRARRRTLDEQPNYCFHCDVDFLSRNRLVIKVNPRSTEVYRVQVDESQRRAGGRVRRQQSPLPVASSQLTFFPSGALLLPPHFMSRGITYCPNTVSLRDSCLPDHASVTSKLARNTVLRGN